MKKARTANDVTVFEQIPNVGPRIADDFKTLGIKTPAALGGKDPYVLYQSLCKKTGVRHDPWVLDTFIAVTRFMNGEAPKPWWHYTVERKKVLAGKRK
jgi:hypothetical protein